MRPVTITAKQFEDLVYPTVAMVPLAQIVEGQQVSETDRRILYKLLDRLEEPAEPRAVDAEEDNPRFDLQADSVVFKFDDREADLLARYLVFATDRMAPVVARRYKSLIRRCEKGDPAYDDNGVAVDATD